MRIHIGESVGPLSTEGRIAWLAHGNFKVESSLRSPIAVALEAVLFDKGLDVLLECLFRIRHLRGRIHSCNLGLFCLLLFLHRLSVKRMSHSEGDAQQGGCDAEIPRDSCAEIFVLQSGDYMTADRP